MSEPEILTVKQVAEALQITSKSVWRLIKKGDLPALKVANEWRILRSDLEKFIAHRLTWYGERGVAPSFFRHEVLERYRGDRLKYTLSETAFSGRLVFRQRLWAHMTGYKPLPWETPFVTEVRYQKVTLKNGPRVVVLSPREMQKVLSIAEEYGHWQNFQIAAPDLPGAKYEP